MMWNLQPSVEDLTIYSTTGWTFYCQGTPTPFCVSTDCLVFCAHAQPSSPVLARLHCEVTQLSCTNTSWRSTEVLCRRPHQHISSQTCVSRWNGSTTISNSIFNQLSKKYGYRKCNAIRLHLNQRCLLQQSTRPQHKHCWTELQTSHATQRFFNMLQIQTLLAITVAH